MENYFLLLFTLTSTFLGAQIDVNFSADNLSGCELAEVNFTDASTTLNGTITEWNWQIGSINSADQNPQFLLNQVGTYDVCLTVTTSTGSSATNCKTDYITIHPNPEVLFQFTQDKTCTPSTVSFVETSPAQITSWTWDIGGSANILSTTDPNEPIRTTYNESGNYSVSLLITDINGCSNIMTQQNLITVDQSPLLDIETNIPSACELPVQVEFINNNVQSDVTYNWDFGQGELYTGTDPPIANFSADGEYVYRINAVGDLCELEMSDTIRITTDPNFSFTYPTEKCAENSFFLWNNSGVVYDSIEWRTNTGLLFTSNANTSVQISDPGCYEFNATIYVNDCVFQFQLPECITITEKPVPNITVDIVDPCNLPTWVYINSNVASSFNPQWSITNGEINITSNNAVDSFQLFTPDIYTVELKIETPDNCKFTYDIPDIIVDEMSVFFTEPFLGGCAPVTHNLSAEVNAATEVSYTWSIPDLGINNTNPSFDVTLIDTGAYLVNLMVENEAGCTVTIQQENYLAAGMVPVTGMAFDDDPVCSGGPLNLEDQSSDFANEWLWTINNSQNWGYGESIAFEFPDTGYFDIVHTTAHHSCPGDTIVQEDAVYVSGPIINFEIEQSCGAASIVVNSSFIDADDYNWTIELDGNDFVTTMDTFEYAFDTAGEYAITGYAINNATGCVKEITQQIFVSDIPFFDIDTTQGCIPLEITVLFDPNLISTFEAPEAEFLSLDPGIAKLRYNKAGMFPSPFVIRQFGDICIDTIRTDSILVNEVVAKFKNDQKFCAPELHQLNNTSTSLFGTIETVNWNLADGLQYSTDYDAAFYIDDDQIYSMMLIVEDSWSCSDSLFRPNALQPTLLLPNFDVDSVGCTDYEFEFLNTSVGQDIVSVLWDFGDGTSMEEIELAKHKFSNEGSYNVCMTAEESIGCSKTICKEIVVRNPIANFSADPTSIDCPPLLVNFTNSSENANQFSWDFGDNSGSSPIDAPSHIYNEVDDFNVQLIASYNGFCQDTLTIADLINISGPKGEWEFEILNNCTPLEVVFTGESDSQYKYTWDFGDGNLAPPTSPQITDVTNFTYNTPGIYYPKLLLDNGTGCIIAIESDTIEVNDLGLDVDYTDGIFCASPGTVNLTNLSDSSDPNTQYTWTFQNQNQSIVSTEENPQFEIFDPGSFEIKLHGEAINCIDSIIIQDLLVIEQIGVFAPSDTICFDEESVLYGSGTAINYQWQNLNGETLSNSDSLAIRLTEDESFVLIGSRPGCQDATSTSQIFVSDELNTSFQTEYISYSNLSARFDIEYEGNLSFMWSPPNGLSCTTCPNPIMSPDSTTNYLLTITDLDSGCMTENRISVSSVAACTLDGLISPNILSKSSNGNDQARVYLENEEEFITMSIFDRWGNQVFKSSNINDSWDARYNGQPVSDGVYIMQIQAICSETQEPYTVYRDLTIVR